MLDEQPGFMMQLDEVYFGKAAKSTFSKKWKQKKVMSVIVILLVPR